jgi:hypothetical protein
MSTAITMQDLELETAELLPARETLNVCCSRHSSGSSVTQVNYGIGNTNQNGGFIQVSALNGNFSGNSFEL